MIIYVKIALIIYPNDFRSNSFGEIVLLRGELQIDPPPQNENFESTFCMKLLLSMLLKEPAPTLLEFFCYYDFGTLRVVTFF